MKNPKDPAFEDEKVQFLTNVNGDVDSLAVPFEPSVKPIVFTMRSDARLSDPDYLKKFTGEYERATQTVGVRLEGHALVLDQKGQRSVTLVPDRNDGFRLKNQSTVIIRFVTAKDTNTIQLNFETPEGVFTAKRKAN